jgi:TANK-binding kinase 1
VPNKWGGSTQLLICPFSDLTYNDEQFHMLEKIKMQETSKVLQSLLNHECMPTLTHVADALADWFK